ncbi:galactoside 2-alpha-L-fucosyltransferase-like [Mercurialis annua]|uniref:galactoside 2-alpha-L-fucosyltransferase-like n=1 Tax=Mercurialis annua TaxID=3986 RepID=UPI00215F26B2|nr:galactoside 2-alpha-L-fucosyltransferase-like [Mercurialis annua]
MEMFQINRENWGFDYKKFTTVIFIVLPVSIMASMLYWNLPFDQSRVFEATSNNSIVPTSSPESQILQNQTLDSRTEAVSHSKNASPGSDRNPDGEMLNTTTYPGIGNVSCSRNCSSQLTNDKLIDEVIIPSGFDEKACLSRYESVMYRKNSPHKPSAYLLSKLRNYEKLHKTCGPDTKSYNRTLKRLNQNRTSKRSLKCNYIIWIPANGLGNRIVSMASTFLYALLTNRVLLVDHGTDMADLFCEPFPDTSWLLPNHFPVRNHGHIRYSRSFGSINTSTDSPPSHLYLNLDHSNYDLDKKLFYCDKTEPFLRKINWLFLLSDQYFAPYFFMSKSYKEEVSKLFPEKETIFYHLGHYLFNPSNQAWGLITRFYDAYLAKADQRLGIQVRVFNPKTTPLQTVLDQVLACTLKEKLLPKVLKTQKPEAHTQYRNKKSKAILVTSLYSSFYGNLSDMYWTKATETDEIIGVYQPSHEGYQHFSDNMHNMKAWAEIYLLSLSDVLVTSGWSTFGYVAQGLGGLKPWILFKIDGDKLPNPPCTRDLSMEPCFHVPPTYNCQEEGKVFDASIVFSSFKHCLDLSWGIKLVSNHD